MFERHTPILEAISSSKVTIFSFCFAVELLDIFLGALTVNGMKWGNGGDSVEMDRSNSLMLRGTKYSTKGSAPKIEDILNDEYLQACTLRYVFHLYIPNPAADLLAGVFRLKLLFRGKLL